MQLKNAFKNPFVLLGVAVLYGAGAFVLTTDHKKPAPAPATQSLSEIGITDRSRAIADALAQGKKTFTYTSPVTPNFQ